MERQQYVVVDASEEADILQNGIRRTWQSLFFEDGNYQINKDHVPLMKHISKSSPDNLKGFLMIKVNKQIPKVNAIPDEIGNYFLSYKTKDVKLKPDEFTIVDRFRSTWEPDQGGENGFL